ncbi:MAG: ClbS/DfsB family four-helix bundle protein [Bacteroidota bacterium]
MPRPQSKTVLLTLSQERYRQLLELVHSYSAAEVHREFPPGSLNRNIRDVLAHLHHWHHLLLGWYAVGMRGEKPAMPAPGYTWKTLPALNHAIWQQYQTTDLDAARELLDESYRAVRELIQRHSDAELFEKRRYPWTGSTSLGAYLVSNTSSHYAWAIKLIRKSMK